MPPRVHTPAPFAGTRTPQRDSPMPPRVHTPVPSAGTRTPQQCPVPLLVPCEHAPARQPHAPARAYSRTFCGYGGKAVEKQRAYPRAYPVNTCPLVPSAGTRTPQQCLTPPPPPAYAPPSSESAARFISPDPPQTPAADFHTPHTHARPAADFHPRRPPPCIPMPPRVPREHLSTRTFCGHSHTPAMPHAPARAYPCAFCGYSYTPAMPRASTRTP